MMNEFKQACELILEKCKDDVRAMRASQATPALVENIMISVYDTLSPLMQLASINCPDTRSIVIQPWDKSIIKNIEKSLTEADLGMNPMNDGDIIRLNMPQLTEETRKHLVKNLKDKVEDYRIRLRQERDVVRDEIQKAEKNKELTEDDRYKMYADIDNLISEYNQILKDVFEKKEAEIMKV
jgi:ribosome recycling factor